MFKARASLHSLLFLVSLSLVSSFPVRRPRDWIARDAEDGRTRSITLPLQARKVAKRAYVEDLLAGAIGLGDYQDMVYTVSVQIGNTTTTLNLDTGSSDLWVMSTGCDTTVCQETTSIAYSTSGMTSTGASVNLTYGDSTTGTYASGPIGLDTVTLAGLSMNDQPFAAVDNTDNSAVLNGGAGIIGLGFPSESFIETQLTNEKFNNPTTTDDFVSHISAYGPIVSRLVAAGEIDQPLFAVTLQRDTVDVSGKGQLTIGELPDGVENASITWVPVRLYSSADGGLSAPTFASDEVYPLRWEVPIDNVYLDGKVLANSTIAPDGVTTSFIDALIDTGNSLIRGPQDVVNNILSTVSPAYAADSSAKATLPCTDAHTLAFEIGGKMFSVDPRDFVSQNQTGNATECVASSVTSTDPPSLGSLFSWSLGDPFLKSNLAVFYYGNLTNPSVDPPRIGFMSMVPSNASELLDEAVSKAEKDGGDFSTTLDVAPTASTVVDIPVTITSTSSGQSYSMTAADVSSKNSSSAASSTSRSIGSLLFCVVLVVSTLLSGTL
ncbi:acid protease [Laetiporus sulphureus 93-53]|uniref:Acid protease n=1 Tax=Laetiporus sulphureus 93-53 TaxID=1314785 RepID=A0A165HMJ9_9APHY|nr:acid protease [Laetiporus sulphureus 93-53]KZT11931.1 acid protease [Laetiporus sulphureus 93-53]